MKSLLQRLKLSAGSGIIYRRRASMGKVAMVSKKRLIFNAATFVPGVTLLPPVKRVLARRALQRTGGTDQARYCYSVWLRHLTLAAANGLNCAPAVVAELGPGDSLGIGLAAILSGAERYYAFDVVAHASAERNLAVVDELVELFRARADVPDASEFPRVGPTLQDYRFPAHVLTEERLQRALDPARLARIKDSLRNCAAKSSLIQYRAPWSSRDAVEEQSLDMVFSQATLEHVDDLADVYRAMYLWLKPGGYISHQIDFKCHEPAMEWNGHWTYSDFMWKLARGKDVWLINRQPYSTHVGLMKSCGFRIVGEQRVRKASNVTRRQLAPRFRSLGDDDLTTTDAFIQAVRPAMAS
jgi:SAM-dependent methyltransferase